MIELDDSLTLINLGLKEYNTLNILGIKTIRQFLLFDTDQVYYLQRFKKTTSGRLAVWQKLLRRYLTYEKIHRGRKVESPPEEDLKIHDSITKTGIDSQDIKHLKALGIDNLLEFLQADLDTLVSGKEIDQSTVKHLVSLQEEFLKKGTEDHKLPEEPLAREKPARTTKFISERFVTPKEFLDEPVSEIGLEKKELEILINEHISTVREFMEFNLITSRSIVLIVLSTDCKSLNIYNVGLVNENSVDATFGVIYSLDKKPNIIDRCSFSSW